MLKDTTTQQEFKIVLFSKFQVLEVLPEEDTTNEKWQVTKESFTSTCKEVLGLEKATPQGMDVSRDPQKDLGEKGKKAEINNVHQQKKTGSVKNVHMLAR